MILKLHRPQSELGDYVDMMTYHKGYKPEYEIERLLPDGAVVIIFNLDSVEKFIFDNSTLSRKQKCEKVWISGMQREYLSISSGYDSEMLVVAFKPGSSYPFLQLPLEELNDLVVDAELVVGPELLEVREALIDCGSPETMIRKVEEWLMSRLASVSFQQQIIHYAISSVQKNPSLMNLSQLADRTGYSQKQLIQLFKKYVGLTPKAFQKIVRFNKVLSEIHSHRTVDWMSVAVDCGYYDQAHFIKDFQFFSGINPESYLKEQGQFANYIPVR